MMEFGNWIFGGVIAFNLVMLGAVLTIEPIDGAVRVAIAANAVALPPSLVGLVLFRLIAGLRSIHESQTAQQTFHEAGFTLEGLPLSERQAAVRRLNRVVLRFTNALLILSVVLTLVGLAAALWHGAWWIPVAFLAALALSLGTLVVGVAMLARGGARWRTPDGRVATTRRP